MADKPRAFPPARVVVGMDFGTSFSGFAVALAADPNDAAAAPGPIHSFYEWPMQERGGRNFKACCKTQTSLLYAPPQPRPAAPPSKLKPASDHPLADDVKHPLLEKPKPVGLLKRIRGRSSKVSPGGHGRQYQLTHWGWPAQVAYLDSPQARRQDVPAGAEEGEQAADAGAPEWFVSGGIKLLLAGSDLLKDVPKFDPTRICDPQAASEERSKTAASWSSKKLAWLRKRLLLSKSDDRRDKNGLANILPRLPPGITVERAISDYLAKLAHLALTHVQANYGSHITMREVQWCLTVPSIWDDSAKNKMARCAEQAGMVTGDLCPAHLVDSASPHPLEMVPESEAAALFCARTAAASGALRKGDQVVVADVGGGTVDIAVHSLEDDQGTQVAEVAMSSGGLCGGAFVDSNFIAYLAHRVPCFRDYVARNPAGLRIVMRRWEEIKCGFDGSADWGSRTFELPARLAASWKSFDRGLDDHHHGGGSGGGGAPAVPGGGGGIDKKEGGYDEIEISRRDMAAIFDPVVDKVVQLIKEQVTGDGAVRARALMLVGGFSASPYLVKRVREEIGEQGLVTSIIAPPNPGSAICRGAVMFGLRPDSVVARISRKTYGIETFRLVWQVKVYDWEEYRWERGLGLCGWDAYRVEETSTLVRIFSVHVRRGDVVRVNQCVPLTYVPLYKNQKSINFRVYSSDQPSPRFTSKHGTRLEGKFVVDISDDPHKLGLDRKVKVTMDFRRSGIHVYAQRENVGDTTEVFWLNHTVPFNAH